MFLFDIFKEKKISSKQEFRINERIRVEKVRLVDENGENAGIVSTSEALHEQKPPIWTW